MGQEKRKMCLLYPLGTAVAIENMGKKELQRRELNPGRPRDRRKCYQLHHAGFVTVERDMPVFFVTPAFQLNTRTLSYDRVRYYLLEVALCFPLPHTQAAF